jgi:thymidylate synthase ThyX
VSRCGTPARPYDAAIAAARTCLPRVIGADGSPPPARTIGPLTFEGGHHTVWQHAHFEFGLENVSRQFVWSFLHCTPSTLSGSSPSQRFVRLDEVRALSRAWAARPSVYEAAIEGRGTATAG